MEQREEHFTITPFVASNPLVCFHSQIFPVLFVSNRLGQLGSCEIAKKGIQKTLAFKTTSLG